MRELTAIFASSMNILMKSPSSAMFGRIRLIAMMLSKPSTPKVFGQTSAMPPTLMRSSSRYFPKGMGCFFGVGMVKGGLPA